jgi:hypothetical protein
MDEPQTNNTAVAYAAFVRAQQCIKRARRVGHDREEGYRYATLDEIVSAARKALADCGLAVTQWPSTRFENRGRDGLLDCYVDIEAVILHESGESMNGPKLTIPVIRPDAKGIGSAITYGRKYQYAAIVGVTPEGEDDDGRSAAGLPDDLPPGAGDTTRLHLVASLSNTKRKGRPYYRVKMHDAIIYGSHDAKAKEAILSANGADVDVSWKPSKSEGEREILAVTAVPPDQQSEEPIV